MAFIKVKTTETGVFTIKKREANAALRDEWKKVGETWHSKFRPNHFKVGATRRYNYAKRKKRYTAEKRKAHGHYRPLTFSGDTRKATENVNIKSTPNNVKIIMGAGKLNFPTRNSKVNMREEFLKVTQSEINQLRNQMQNGLDERIRRHNAQRRRYHSS
jgi:hypothetical protein